MICLNESSYLSWNSVVTENTESQSEISDAKCISLFLALLFKYYIASAKLLATHFFFLTWVKVTFTNMISVMFFNQTLHRS